MAHGLLDVRAMMRRFVVIAVTALSAMNAHAEPEPRGSVGLGISLVGWRIAAQF